MKSEMTSHSGGWRVPSTCLTLAAALLSFCVHAQKPAAIEAADQAKAPTTQAPALKPVKAPPQDAKCMECHEDIFEEPVIHVALEKGCSSCHGNLDASKRPHKSTGRVAMGLTLSGAELCLSCHEKPKFKNKSTHEALDKGCSDCHESHSSKHKKLLKTPTPDLCYTCHDKKGFAGKGTHDAVKSGNCRSCHDSHASVNAWLLKKAPAELCLECHDEIKEAPHVVAGFSRNGHPIGDEKRAKPAEDPLRPGKPFYCGSCHLPHKGEFAKLQRLDPKLAMGTCQKCHQM